MGAIVIFLVVVVLIDNRKLRSKVKKIENEIKEAGDTQDFILRNTGTQYPHQMKRRT
jgi:hypothetical protein